MRKIYKYTLSPLDSLLYLPEGSTILKAAAQNEEVCLWVEVTPNNPSKAHQYYIFGTGHPFKIPEKIKYLDTVLLENGSLVFHVYIER